MGGGVLVGVGKGVNVGAGTGVGVTVAGGIGANVGCEVDVGVGLGTEVGGVSDVLVSIEVDTEVDLGVGVNVGAAVWSRAGMEGSRVGNGVCVGADVLVGKTEVACDSVHARVINRTANTHKNSCLTGAPPAA